MSASQKKLSRFCLYGLTGLLFLQSGCAVTHALLHPFTPPAAIQESLPAAPAPSFSILHPFSQTQSAPTASPVPVKLATGQTVLMVPASSQTAPMPEKTPVKKAIDYLLWLVWFGGFMAIAAGAICIVWLGQLWLGLKLIGCSIAAIIIGTWFAAHYIVIIALCFAAAGVWIIFDHVLTWASIHKWFEDQTADVKKIP